MGDALYAALALALLMQAPSPAPPPASVEGRVIRADADSPVPNAHIVLTRTGGRLTDSAVAEADDQGRFVVTGIPAGTWRLFADLEDYVRAEYAQPAPGAPGASLTLAPGQTIGNLTIAMTPAGVIAGRVSGKNGETGSRIRVKALQWRYEKGARVLRPVAESQVNDLGEYRFFDLAPGPYVIRAEPFGFQRIEGGSYVTAYPPALDVRMSIADNRTPLESMLRGGAFISPAALAGESFPPVYYPGTILEVEAEPVVVRPGAVTLGIDFRIVPAVTSRSSGVRVSGQLIDGRTGLPVSPSGGGFALVTLNSKGLLLGLESELAQQELQTPSFEFNGITPGTYLLLGQAGGQLSRLSIDVGSADLNNLRIVLNPVIALRGRIAIEGATGRTDTDLQKMEVRLSDDRRRWEVAPDGTFSLRYIEPGDYRVTVERAPANYFIKTAHLGDADVLANGFHVAAPTDQRLEILLSAKAAVIDTQVLDREQRPVPAAVVVLVPEAPLRARFELYRTAVTDIAGKARIEGVPPGRYKVFAWPHIEQDSWQDPSVIAADEEHSRPVVVREGVDQRFELQSIEPR